MVGCSFYPSINPPTSANIVVGILILQAQQTISGNYFGSGLTYCINKVLDVNNCTITGNTMGTPLNAYNRTEINMYGHSGTDYIDNNNDFNNIYGVMSTPFDNVRAKVGLNMDGGATVAAPTAATNYTICDVNQLWTVSGGADVSITIYDPTGKYN